MPGITLLCLVVAISDGDTLKVRCDDQPQITIRVAAIDAPEKAQPFGQVSRQNLARPVWRRHMLPRGDRLNRLGPPIGHRHQRTPGHTLIVMHPHRKRN